MKRQGNLLIFAFFGLFCETALLLLLQANPAEHIIGFVLAANVFVFYRVFIEEKRAKTYIQKELRRWWLRQEPENNISFAFIGGMLLFACNFGLWGSTRPMELWANGFMAIALTQMSFETGRQLWNGFSAYLSESVKNWRISRKVTRIGGEEKKWTSQKC